MGQYALASLNSSKIRQTKTVQDVTIPVNYALRLVFVQFVMQLSSERFVQEVHSVNAWLGITMMESTNNATNASMTAKLALLIRIA